MGKQDGRNWWPRGDERRSVLDAPEHMRMLRALGRYFRQRARAAARGTAPPPFPSFEAWLEPLALPTRPKGRRPK